MPKLINDWDNAKGVVVRYASKCRRCKGTQITDTPDLPEGWTEDTGPNTTGRTTACCPDCSN